MALDLDNLFHNDPTPEQRAAQFQLEQARELDQERGTLDKKAIVTTEAKGFYARTDFAGTYTGSITESDLRTHCRVIPMFGCRNVRISDGSWTLTRHDD